MNNLLEDAIFNLRSTVHHSWRETLCRDSSAPVSRALATPSFKGRAEYDTSERRIRESFPCWQRFRRFFSRNNRRGDCEYLIGSIGCGFQMQTVPIDSGQPGNGFGLLMIKRRISLNIRAGLGNHSNACVCQCLLRPLITVKSRRFYVRP